MRKMLSEFRAIRPVRIRTGIAFVNQPTWIGVRATDLGGLVRGWTRTLDVAASSIVGALRIRPRFSFFNSAFTSSRNLLLWLQPTRELKFQCH